MMVAQSRRLTKWWGSCYLLERKKQTLKDQIIKEVYNTHVAFNSDSSFNIYSYKTVISNRCKDSSLNKGKKMKSILPEV